MGRSFNFFAERLMHTKQKTMGFAFALAGVSCVAQANTLVKADVDSSIAEPATAAMIAAGLGLMGFIVRRRTKRGKRNA